MEVTNEEFQKKLKEEFGDSEEINRRIKEEKDKEEADKVRIILNETYEKIIEVLKQYCDLREEYYPIVALWIIGTYVHDSFKTYGYLFINAMRGSGKTKLLKLIATLSKNGELLTSLREAVLFRTAKDHTLCIDEFEGLATKENTALRELLNACYKKGMKVKRMVKKKNLYGEEQVVEEFEPYTPICMANIWGMEEVLGDRCITLTLEKSSNPRILYLVEDFEADLNIKCIKSNISTILVSLCRLFGDIRYISSWNYYINQRYIDTTTLTTQSSYTPLNTLELKQEEIDMFNKIVDSDIKGRNLELTFPLLLISHFLSEELFNYTLQIISKVVKEREFDEINESNDISIIDYVSQTGIPTWISIKEFTTNFRQYMNIDDAKEYDWINTKWIGRALKRLNLIRDKRRLKAGREVILDVQKAIEKIKMFKGEKKC